MHKTLPMLALMIAVCSSPSGIRPSGTQAEINASQPPYSAKGDGSTDDTTAINQALEAAAQSTPKRAVYLPQGTYVHSGILNVAGVSLFGDGIGTVVEATGEDQTAIELTGSGSRIGHMRLTAPNETRRSSHSAATAVYVNGADHFVVTDITIGTHVTRPQTGSGIICATMPSSFGVIRGNHIYNTLADAIHLTHGSHSILVEGNTVENSGDDMIAVVSYLHDGVQCHDIRIVGNHCLGQTHGRGITVVGGEDIDIENNEIANSSAAGLYFVAEKSYETMGVAHVKAVNNTLRKCNTVGIWHGAIFVEGRPAPPDGGRQDFHVRDIKILGNTVDQCCGSGIHISGYTSGIEIAGNTISQTAAEGIAINYTSYTGAGTGASNVTITGNTIRDTGTGGVKVFAGAAGKLKIADNMLYDIDTANNKAIDAIFVDPGATAAKPLTIIGNAYSNPGRFSVRNFILCGPPAGESAASIRTENRTTSGRPIIVAQ